MVFVEPQSSPVTERVESEFEIREVTQSDDPLVDAICPPWQRPWANRMFDQVFEDLDKED